MSETRKLYSEGKLTVIGKTIDDDSDPNFPDFDSREDAENFQKHFANGDFVYVGLVVTVDYDGAEIASDSIWGTEHGYLGEYAGKPVNSDAWENTPAEYGINEATGLRTVTMGSTLNGVITEALGNAAEWAEKNGSAPMSSAIEDATKWADPNAR